MLIQKVPPNHVRVLLVRDKGLDLLREAATRVLAGESPAPYMHEYEAAIKPWTVDYEFGAIALGPGRPDAALSPDALRPENATRFLIRAFIHADAVAHGFFQGGRIFADPPTASFKTCITSPAVGTTSTVGRQLGIHTLMTHGLDGLDVTIAVVDSGIYLPHLIKRLERAPLTDPANSWRPLDPLSTEPFGHRLGHGTMCAYDALIAAPNATLLDVPMLLTRAPGQEHSTEGTIGAASHAFRHLECRWNSGQLKACEALVINNSWGIYHPSLDFDPGHPGRYIDNPEHPFHEMVSEMAQFDIDILFAGNNCGEHCKSPTCLSQWKEMIMGASGYKEVLTIAGCDTDDEIVDYSTPGPSIRAMHQEKPDITAYTHFIGAQTQRAWLPDAGVSAACGVASGCVAALRSKRPAKKVSPADLFGILRESARGGVGGGPGGQWSREYGYGIIDPVAAARKLGLVP